MQEGSRPDNQRDKTLYYTQKLNQHFLTFTENKNDELIQQQIVSTESQEKSGLLNSEKRKSLHKVCIASENDNIKMSIAM